MINILQKTQRGGNVQYIVRMIKHTNHKKVIIFGTGQASEIIVNHLEEKIHCFLDNNPMKQGGSFLCSPVKSIEYLSDLDLENVSIIVASMYFKEIAEQLVDMGLEEEKHYWNGMRLYNMITRQSLLEEKNNKQYIYLDYPINPINRYGYDKPPHPELFSIIERFKESYQQYLSLTLNYKANLNKIKKTINEAHSLKEPYWENSYMSGLDAIALYVMVSHHKPSIYMEIGSGNSTKFTKRAIEDQDLGTKIVSIDPFPRAEIDEICDEVYRTRVEDMDLSSFERLESGDILFVDNSHRCFTNSDVTVFFLEILPRLKKGVIVQIHDIYLPYDYPETWRNRFYSEQYLLACYLLDGCDKFDILLSNAFITRTNLINQLEPVWEMLERKDVFQRRGSSFWLVVK